MSAHRIGKWASERDTLGVTNGNRRYTVRPAKREQAFFISLYLFVDDEVNIKYYSLVW